MTTFRLTEPYADEKEAKKAAQSKAKELQRDKGSASVTVVGDTSIIAGAPLLFQDVRPGLDGVPYIIDSVEHSYSKGGGYTTKISAKLYDGKSAKGSSGGSGSGGSGSASAAKGKVAPDAPAGTPATPPQFASPRSMGLST